MKNHAAGEGGSGNEGGLRPQKYELSISLKRARRPHRSRPRVRRCVGYTRGELVSGNERIYRLHDKQLENLYRNDVKKSTEQR